MNANRGYLVHFELYLGESLKSNSNHEKFFGKAADPFLVLLDEIPDEKVEFKYKSW